MMPLVRFADGRIIPRMQDEELYFSPYENLLIERLYGHRPDDPLYSFEDLNPPDEKTPLKAHEREEHAWTLYDEIRRHRLVEEGYLRVFTPVRRAWDHYTLDHELTGRGFCAFECISEDMLWNRLQRRPAVTASIRFWDEFLDKTTYDEQYQRLRIVAELRSDHLYGVRKRVPEVRRRLFENEARRKAEDPLNRFWDVLAQTAPYPELDGLRARRLELHIAAWQARVGSIRDKKSKIFDEVALLGDEYQIVKDEAFHRKLLVWVPDTVKETR